MDFHELTAAKKGLAAALAVSRPSDLAKALGISCTAVCQWHVVPPYRVLEVERITGVRRERLRPDLYPSDGEQK